MSSPAAERDSAGTAAPSRAAARGSVRTRGTVTGPPRPAARREARAGRPSARQDLSQGGVTGDPATVREGPAVRRETAGGSVRSAPSQQHRAARAPFVVVVVAVLVVGLLALLVLNTVLAQDSFRLHALQAATKQLAVREQALTREVDSAQAPAELARKATELGLVEGGPPAFLHLPDGALLGKPSPAAAPVVAALPTAPPAGLPSPGAPTPAVPGAPTPAVSGAPTPAVPGAPTPAVPGASTPAVPGLDVPDVAGTPAPAGGAAAIAPSGAAASAPGTSPTAPVSR